MASLSERALVVVLLSRTVISRNFLPSSSFLKDVLALLGWRLLRALLRRPFRRRTRLVTPWLG